MIMLHSMIEKFNKFIDDDKKILETFITVCIISIVGIILILVYCQIENNNRINKLQKQVDVRDEYIHELEHIIELDGTYIPDICDGEGYFQYYNE